MVNEPTPPPAVNPSAYAVWRALVKSELNAWKNGFLKMHLAVRAAIVLFVSILILGAAFVAVIALFLPNLVPDELTDIEAASSYSALVLGFLFYFTIIAKSGLNNQASSVNLPMLAPLPVPLSSLYAFEIALNCLHFSILFLMGLPFAAFTSLAFRANLLQAAAYYIGWISLYLFSIGASIGAATLLLRWFGAERSKKAFQIIIFLMIIGFWAAMLNISEIADSMAGAVEIGKRLLPALPSTWTVYILTDPLLALALFPALLIVGAGGILFGYAVFIRTFDMEAELMRIEKKEESGKRKASSRRRGVFASLLVKDYKIIVRNRKMLGGWIFSLGIWGVYLSYSLLDSTSPDTVGTIANSYAMPGAFFIGLSLPGLEGRAVLSVRMAMSNLRMYAVSKASSIVSLLFIYALIGLAAKQKALPALPDIAVVALIVVGHGCFCIGIACVFPRFDIKKPIGCASAIYFTLFFAATAVAFGFAPTASHVWIAAAVCVLGVVILDYGRKRLESADAVW